MMVDMSYGNFKAHWPMLAALIAGLLVATNVGAHPYDDPLRFEAHTHEDGRVIFTNIPKRCFRDGVLICHQLHPLLNNTPAPEPGEQRPRIEQNRE